MRGAKSCPSWYVYVFTVVEGYKVLSSTSILSNLCAVHACCLMLMGRTQHWGPSLPAPKLHSTVCLPASISKAFPSVPCRACKPTGAGYLMQKAAKTSFSITEPARQAACQGEGQAVISLLIKLISREYKQHLSPCLSSKRTAPR